MRLDSRAYRVWCNSTRCVTLLAAYYREKRTPPESYEGAVSKALGAATCLRGSGQGEVSHRCPTASIPSKGLHFVLLGRSSDLMILQSTGLNSHVGFSQASQTDPGEIPRVMQAQLRLGNPVYDCAPSLVREENTQP